MIKDIALKDFICITRISTILIDVFDRAFITISFLIRELLRRESNRIR